MIVRVDELTAALAAENLRSPIRNDLIDVHVRRGAGARLKDIYWKVLIQAPVRHLLGCCLNRGSDDIRLFEAGNVFEASGADSKLVEKALEAKRISIGVTGNVDAEVVRGLAPGTSARPFSFFDLKGDIESLLAPFSHWTLYYDAQTADYYHPGRSARAVLDGVKLNAAHR